MSPSRAFLAPHVTPLPPRPCGPPSLAPSLHHRDRGRRSAPRRGGGGSVLPLQPRALPGEHDRVQPLPGGLPHEVHEAGSQGGARGRVCVCVGGGDTASHTSRLRPPPRRCHRSACMRYGPTSIHAPIHANHASDSPWARHCEQVVTSGPPPSCTPIHRATGCALGASEGRSCPTGSSGRPARSSSGGAKCWG